jgi:proteasome lid subunit RPN8/RPN11
MRRLEISDGLLSGLVERARTTQPLECCGILLGRLGAGRVRVESVIDAENIAAEPSRRYEIEPTVLLAAQRRARREDLDVVGYYHSHPGGRTTASERDRAAAWPETSYLIVSTVEDAGGRPRCWSLGPTGELEEDEVLVTREE